MLTLSFVGRMNELSPGTRAATRIGEAMDTEDIQRVTELIKLLRHMSDKRSRREYDIGHYWNACDDAAEALEALVSDRRRE